MLKLRGGYAVFRTNVCIGLVAVLAAMMLVPVTGVTRADSGGGPSDELPEKRQWSIMIYFGADNDYEEIVDFTIGQCYKALSENKNASGIDDLYVVMMVDKKSSKGTWIYSVTPDESSLEAVDSWPEMNSSDPNTLKTFLEYCDDNYPADNRVLVVKNGHAWCGVCPDETELNEDYLMPLDGVAAVLESVKDPQTGEGIDMIVFDGDNMASLEGVYELRHAVDYFVGSQQDVPLDGFPYYLFLSDLAKAPEMPVKRLAEVIVSDFVYYYNNTDGKKNKLDHLLSNSQMAVTASAFEMGEDGALVEQIAVRFGELINYMLYGPEEEWRYNETTGELVPWDWIPLNRNNISSARDFALIGKMGDQAGYEWLPDVYSWFIMLEDLANMYPAVEGELVDPIFPVLVDAFTDAMNASCFKMEQCQILNRSGNSDPHGLNIWFPPSWTQWEYLNYTRERTYLYDGSKVPLPAEYYCIDCPFDYDECGLDLVESTNWMAFFEVYYDSRWLIYSSGQGNTNPIGKG